MYNDNNENESQYRYSGSDIPYNNTNNSSTANNNTAFSSAPYEAKKHKKHKGGFAKKAACFVLSAVLFGAIAGSVMFGVNYAGGKIAGSNKSDATGVNIPTVIIFLMLLRQILRLQKILIFQHQVRWM